MRFCRQILLLYLKCKRNTSFWSRKKFPTLFSSFSDLVINCSLFGIPIHGQDSPSNRNFRKRLEKCYSSQPNKIDSNPIWRTKSDEIRPSKFFLVNAFSFFRVSSIHLELKETLGRQQQQQHQQQQQQQQQLSKWTCSTHFSSHGSTLPGCQRLQLLRQRPSNLNSNNNNNSNSSNDSNINSSNSNSSWPLISTSTLQAIRYG